MPAHHTAFIGSVPEKYDRYMGPIFFEPYARDIVERILPVSEGANVLELACGTGIVTRRLRDLLPESARLTATDLNETMIDQARRKFGSGESVEWKQADAAALPFPADSFNVAVCQFGLMFFPDKGKAMHEIHRVLIPGGKFVFNVWDALEHNDLTLTAGQVIANFFSENPPDFYQVPFGFHDPVLIKELLERSGFRDVQSATVTKTSSGSSALDAAQGLVQGTPIIGQILERAPAADIPAIVEAMANEFSSRYGNDLAESKMQALVFSALKPTNDRTE